MGFYCGNRRIGDDRGRGMGFVTHHEVKGRLAGNRVGVVIVGEFGMGDLLRPGRGVGATEDVEICRFLLLG